MSLRQAAVHLTTDVLVIGSGAAGMAAALAAAREGARVLLADRSLIGRSGATIMAQMTVAVALGEETPDDWEAHFADTMKAGRGLCDCEFGATGMRARTGSHPPARCLERRLGARCEWASAPDTGARS